MTGGVSEELKKTPLLNKNLEVDISRLLRAILKIGREGAKFPRLKRREPGNRQNKINKSIRCVYDIRLST